MTEIFAPDNPYGLILAIACGVAFGVIIFAVVIMAYAPRRAGGGGGGV